MKTDLLATEKELVIKYHRTTPKKRWNFELVILSPAENARTFVQICGSLQNFDDVNVTSSIQSVCLQIVVCLLPVHTSRNV